MLDGGKARKFEKRAQGWQGPGSSEVFCFTQMSFCFIQMSL
jgi:hypothetical protein